MTVSFAFSEEIETALCIRAAAVGKDVAALVTEMVIEQLNDVKPLQPTKVSPEAFSKRSEAWIKLHPVLDHAIDDSRDSIYGGRGE